MVASLYRRNRWSSHTRGTVISINLYLRVNNPNMWMFEGESQSGGPRFSSFPWYLSPPKMTEKVEDDMASTSCAQRRVETTRSFSLASRTSFAARSRSTLRRIFPAGLETDQNISYIPQNSAETHATDLFGISGMTTTPPRRCFGFPTRGLIHSWTSFAIRS